MLILYQHADDCNARRETPEPSLIPEAAGPEEEDTPVRTTPAAPPQQPAPKPELADRVAYLIKQTQHALRTAMDRALAQSSLTTPQYAALTHLESTPDVTAADLARRAFVTPQTMQRLVEGLEAAQLVARTPHPQSRRAVCVALTAKGRRRVASCHARIDAVETQMLSALSEAESRRLAGLLRTCIASLTPRAEPRAARLKKALKNP